MRLEKIAAKALENVGFDRYLLSIAVAKRANELATGKEPLVEVDVKKYKYTDIALMEIAEGKLKIEVEKES
ncbi:DNA-directed RNA polymerase subunit omega [Nitratiruptor sp. SB155-2]|uniref:DNA-directed RNA polymerase subunit omega n=1 Tax=Nitratiruptor sp. (strain SB155-2) TaxID=387092 RepID=RPOZ_NITSB|nr:DNA-directed RNA polymerase subunit omega [Nitratiruptor sp. SB155-2]A6Q312.1 RecName: Full=DNA-directed RNA polymerase subunit omega; Short=RNAP omega subunit; AltName: Full=RNA polymerase omega subunit; AltName: Full=Transcriptase subunit omega [Nitratiruptor sp. SB155-2]BAF69871.1 DNA-directed RNA polymerase, omega subunit [Nitratiruptor sp. SB155-2]